MTTTTAQAFTAFLADLKPTEYQKKTLIPARQAAVVKNLRNSFPEGSDMPFWSAELIGSAAKKTIIRPIDDIDVMAIFSNGKGAYSKYQTRSQDFLYRIREAYNGLQVQQVGARGQAVRIFFQNGGHVDVAPVFFESGDNYLLPAGDGTWIRTSPLKANSWFRQKNEDLGGNLRPLIRCLKAWNRSHSKRFKSFHMETVAATAFSSLGINHRTNLQRFFEWAPKWLSVPDPGGHSSDLSGYLTSGARQQLVDSLGSMAERASRAVSAEASGNHREAKRLWRIVLGEGFPSGD